ncbi:CHAP domain-containing protein [Kitasatospora viridis]|uniref:CHAP domain-containing protein n=1 Tax=Kitasatospora viridis TaxID=281105 RepID=A0A561UC59_9ACTN|nr:CHAP domain-containing protein [Kitasatospora viridis]TWF96936.1 CHAP domain-containing protein [Kitasatospora viridis]
MSNSSLRRAIGTLASAAVLAPALVVLSGSAASANTGTDVANLALANVGKGAGSCSTYNSSANSLGGSAFNGSCQGYAGVPEYWCADFAKWVWQNNGLNVTGITAAAHSFIDAAGSNGSTVHQDSGYRPQLGDAAVFGTSHVGIVTAVNADGSIQLTNGDFSGTKGQGEVTFAETSQVVNVTIPSSQVAAGSFQSNMNMQLTAYVTPSGYSAPNPWANTVHLVDITPDGGLHNTEGNYTANTWSTWGDLGASGVKAVTSANTGSTNRIFIIGSDNNIYENDGNYANGTWSGWRQLIGAPQVKAIAASSYGNTIHLEAIDLNGHLYNSDGDFAAGQWNGWSLVGGGGNNLVKVAATSTTNNTNHIFAIDNTNRLWEIEGNYATGSWGTWADAAGGFQGTDVTASASADTVHLDAIGTDGNLYNTDGNFDTGKWNGWSNAGGTTAGPLKHVTSAAANNVNHIFAVNANNRLIELDANYNTGAWNTWQEPAGGNDSTGATATFTN